MTMPPSKEEGKARFRKANAVGIRDKTAFIHTPKPHKARDYVEDTLPFGLANTSKICQEYLIKTSWRTYIRATSQSLQLL